MIVRRLCSAAKQRLDSSSHTPLSHTTQQATRFLSSNHNATGASWSNHSTPLADRTRLDKPADCDTPLKKSSFRARRAQHASVEEPDKKKKKKRLPPGPVPFESLTAPTAVHSELPFAFRHSYTEIPKVPPVGFQEKFSPFGPGRLDRAWDGQQAVPLSSPSPSSSSSSPTSHVSSLAYPENITKSKYSFKGIKLVNPPSPILSRTHTRRVRTREDVLGEPLTKEEIKELVEKASKSHSRRQINMGRDGLTHNMLIEIHDHWKREPVVRVRCKGVPTIDMDNVLFQLEDKTGGKIIQRAGGTVYLFRGRNYSYKDRPIIPPMLWKPHAPLYPKLITDTPPGGLKVHEANFLRKRGLRIMRLCILSKNGYYGDLVRHVREAFEDDELVRIDCKGLNTSDYKKIGAKLRDIVPCYLLSFEKEQIILWKGRDKNLQITGSTLSSDFEESQRASVDVVKDPCEEGIAVVHERCEDASSTKGSCDYACADFGRRHAVAHIGDTSDEDAESATVLKESVEARDENESSDDSNEVSDVGNDMCEEDEASDAGSESSEACSDTCEEDEACDANF
eukprot:c17960_g1_i1 orf=84-1781(+)